MGKNANRKKAIALVDTLTAGAASLKEAARKASVAKAEKSTTDLVEVLTAMEGAEEPLFPTAKSPVFMKCLLDVINKLASKLEAKVKRALVHYIIAASISEVAAASIMRSFPPKVMECALFSSNVDSVEVASAIAALMFSADEGTLPKELVVGYRMWLKENGGFLNCFTANKVLTRPADTRFRKALLDAADNFSAEDASMLVSAISNNVQGMRFHKKTALPLVFRAIDYVRLKSTSYVFPAKLKEQIATIKSAIEDMLGAIYLAYFVFTLAMTLVTRGFSERLLFHYVMTNIKIIHVVGAYLIGRFEFIALSVLAVAYVSVVVYKSLSNLLKSEEPVVVTESFETVFAVAALADTAATIPPETVIVDQATASSPREDITSPEGSISRNTVPRDRVSKKRKNYILSDKKPISSSFHGVSNRRGYSANRWANSEED